MIKNTTLKVGAVLSRLSAVLWGMIIVLIFTGGITKHIEVSQVDVFALILLAISYAQAKMRLCFIPNFVLNCFRFLSRVYSKKPFNTLLVLFIASVLFYATLQQVRYLSFRANAFDMSYVERSIWSVAYGRGEKFLGSSLSRGETYLGEHFSPILAVIAPFYLIYDDPIWSFILHAALIISGIFGIRVISKNYTVSPQIEFPIIAAYLLYRPIRSGLVFNLKEDAFFIPSFFLMIIGDLRSKPILLYLGAFFAVLTKENAPIAIGLWSLLTFLFTKNRPHKVTVSVLSLLFFFVHSIYLSPLFAGGEQSAMIATRLGYLGSTPKEVLGSIFTRPIYVLSQLFRHQISLATIKYLWIVLGAFTVCIHYKKLFTESNAYLMVGALLIILNIFFTTQRVGFHYELIAVPFLFVGALLCFANKSPKQVIPWFILLILCTYGRSPVLELRQSWPKEKQICWARILRNIDRNLSIATHSDLLPHVHRRHRYKILSDDGPVGEDLVIASFWDEMTYYAGFNSKQIINKMSTEQQFKHRSMILGNLVWCRSYEHCFEIEKISKAQCPHLLAHTPIIHE